MIKKTIVEFAVKNSKQAIEFYGNVLNVKLINLVTANSSGIATNFKRFSHKSDVIIDSLLKVGDDYFKIYEWNDKLDGSYNPDAVNAFSLHLKFNDELAALKIWNKFLKHKDSKVKTKFQKIKTGDIWFMHGIITDPYKINWTFTLRPNKT